MSEEVVNVIDPPVVIQQEEPFTVKKRQPGNNRYEQTYE